SLQGFKAMVDEIAKRKHGMGFESYDTICRSVANRIPNIREFAARHDLILFVCGSKSSNGRILFAECHDANPSSYLISGADEIDPEWLRGKNSIGICGATSTPMWLMNRVKEAVESRL
ncbi:MAG: 4-hydroxy-3-methylbut-2-enyl diphosphate reductase, partial [Bacteroidales bacterium]|nr:4-hydroxy-3-methylbut-2-enyl diphosphate reductase [Bacteroidales bacterium]